MRIFAWKKGLHQMAMDAKAFMEQPWASGGVLIVCVIIAMLLANMPWTRELYHQILETSLSMSIQSPTDPETGVRAINWVFPHEMTVERFINDIMMVVFFFTVGLEIKREVICGELSSVKKAMMPVIAAAGGMAMPALIFTLFNHGTHGASGWGIPTATDIAFAVGIMSILGKRVPVSLKVFLTALAIADDLGAILVVAIFYGGHINMTLLTISLILVAGVLLMNKLGEKRMAFYLVPAIAIWFLFYYSGVHSTMSGVVMAFLIPMGPRYSYAYLKRRTQQYHERMMEYEEKGDEVEGLPFPNAVQRHCLRRISTISLGSMGMSYRLEHALAPWVNFLIMPIFALANAGVEIPDLSYFNIFQWDDYVGSVGMGVFFGLLLGKPIGITLASWLAIKGKFGEMPNAATWKMLFAVACLGGIGFTMSIFVDTLSFGDVPHEVTEHLRATGKIAVLLGSLSAGILGSILISAFHKLEKK
ncbi:MAG: Na+/H+ antiporter NhaA [Bacteroidaceae bacterium]|nr:Na+/H+ antiporter NhaA [Bacteroidaceae bacterium]